MASKASRQLPHERRKGESSLTEFAEYVERQQALRYPQGSSGGSTTTAVEDHAELDILDSLTLLDSSPQVRLKELLLGKDEDSQSKLVNTISLRLGEGRGETIFEAGQEYSGESMSLSREEWDFAFIRLSTAAAKLQADCQLLLTHNVGGVLEAESSNEKNLGTDCSGKILIRQHPTTVEDVIETRIAVVGNVDAGKSTMLGVLVKGGLDDGRGKARCDSQGLSPFSLTC